MMNKNNLQKVIFLDRDGVINENAELGDYIKEVNELKLIPQSKEAIHSLNDAGYRLFIISNQAGINKKIISKKDFSNINKYLSQELRIPLENMYYCPHKKEENCECRKPKSGLLIKASEEHNLYLPQSYYIGDSLEDIIAAKTVGCKMIFVLTGRGNKQMKEIQNCKFQPDLIVNNLYRASNLILEGKL